jgi:Protein of unknown function (DUF664)
MPSRARHNNAPGGVPYRRVDAAAIRVGGIREFRSAVDQIRVHTHGMYAPTPHDELQGIVRYVEQQLDAIRAAIIGLTEEQARQRPCRSTLSLGGLIKHATYGMRGAIERLTGDGQPRTEIDEAAFAAYQASFALSPDETAVEALTAFDGTRVAYIAALASADPSAPTIEDPAPWFGIFENRPARGRYFLVHQIEELARHAGHADILREQIDGMSVPAIVLTADGMPASDYFQPYVPVPGTIGA